MALLPLLFVATAGAEAQLTPTLLPPLPGHTDSMALGINPRGEVVGVSRSGFFVQTAVVWDVDGTPTPLPNLSGDGFSSAVAINPRGEIIGWVSFGRVGTRAVVWR